MIDQLADVYADPQLQWESVDGKTFDSDIRIENTGLPAPVTNAPLSIPTFAQLTIPPGGVIQFLGEGSYGEVRFVDVTGFIRPDFEQSALELHFLNARIVA